MTTVTEIQQAILELPPAEYGRLIAWLRELDWEKWDRQIEADSEAGRLDFLIAEAMEAKEKGELLCPTQK
jgi:hypothetical protein